MIHEIAPHSFNSTFIKDKTTGENDYIFCFRGDSFLWKKDGDEYYLPTLNDFKHLQIQKALIYIGKFNDNSCFLINEDIDIERNDFEYKDKGFFRILEKQELSWLSMVAYQFSIWYKQNKYCGCCGAEMTAKEDERAMRCTKCTHVEFPRISPAIIVAIVSNDKLLLASGSQAPGNRYSLVAGYADVGETLEETVRREVKEEVGLDVSNIQYYTNQPWPLSGSMMIGFIAEADENQPIVVDNVEIKHAQWFSRDNLPNHSLGLSISGAMIDAFKRGEF